MYTPPSVMLQIVGMKGMEGRGEVRGDVALYMVPHYDFHSSVNVNMFTLTRLCTLNMLK